MKINTKLCLLILSILWSSNILGQGIAFEKDSSWEEIKAKAKKENKPIFIDSYTSWCWPCKKMAKTVFTKKKVGTFFNKNFISVKMDMEKNKDGILLAKKHKVKVFPTYLFFDASGQLIHRSTSMQTAEEFIQTGKDAIDPEKQFGVIEKRYESGEMDTNKVLLKKYILETFECSNNWEEPMAKYQELLSEEERFSKNNLLFLIETIDFTYWYNETYTVFFMKNKEKYKKYMSASEIEGYADDIFSQFIRHNAYVKKEYKLKIHNETLNLFPEKEAELAITIAYYKANAKKQNAKVLELLPELTQKSTSASYLNDAAWFIFEKSKDAKKIEEAIGWVDRSLAIKKGYNNLDTKVNLLFKAKRYKEAKESAEELINLGDDEPMESYKGKSQKELAQKLLHKINKKLDK